MLSLESHLIAPHRVLRGENAWLKGKKIIPFLCQKPLLLGRSKSTSRRRVRIQEELKLIGINPIFEELEYDCCDVDLERLKNTLERNHCDGVIAIGGGKVMDSGKLLAHNLKLPCITIPLSAATCAGWTALANIYSQEGAFIRDQPLNSCPNLLIFDHNFVRSAPNRTLASGIADALAKWYEASISSSKSTDGLVQQAVQMARVLRDQLLIDGEEACKDNNSDAWERVAEACALTAGLIGGIGGSMCRTAGAHAFHNGFTQLKASQQSLHGEIVGLGIIIQLLLEEKLVNNQLAKQSRLQLVQFLRKIKLPTRLNDLGLSDIKLSDLKYACRYACKDGLGMEYLPFTVKENELLEVIISSDEQIIELESNDTVHVTLP